MKTGFDRAARSPIFGGRFGTGDAQYRRFQCAEVRAGCLGRSQCHWPACLYARHQITSALGRNAQERQRERGHPLFKSGGCERASEIGQEPLYAGEPVACLGQGVGWIALDEILERRNPHVAVFAHSDGEPKTSEGNAQVAKTGGLENGDP